MNYEPVEIIRQVLFLKHFYLCGVIAMNLFFIEFETLFPHIIHHRFGFDFSYGAFQHHNRLWYESSRENGNR